MKVLFISGADQKYGTYHAAVQLLEGIAKVDKSVELVVITPQQGALNMWCSEKGLENHVIPYRYCVYYPPKNSLLKALKHLVLFIITTFLNRRAVHQIEKRGLLNNVDIIHTNINRDLLGNLLSKRHGIPNITHLREFSKSHFQLAPIYRNQVRFMNMNTAQFVAISDAVKKDWINYGIEKAKTIVVYDGVDTERFRIEPCSRKPEPGLRLIMCGAIYEGKGQLELLEAVADLIREGYDITVDYYGDTVSSDYYQRMNRVIEKDNLSHNIKFKGFVDEISEVLGNYDLGVVCSKAEGFGLATVEYMLGGLCVVASDTGANPELLKNGEYGYLYPLGDIKALRELIRGLYDKKQKGCELLVATEYAADNYSIERTVNDTLKIYHSSHKR